MSTYKEIYQSRPPFIVIAGNIGSGKTTLTRTMSDYIGFKAAYEPVDHNPYLADFYRDMTKYGFAMQVYLLNERFKLHQQIVWGDEGVVQDRSIYEDCIFAQMLHQAGHISDLDFKTYVSLATHMTSFLRDPDLIVYLDVTPENCLERLKIRNREAEAGVGLDYLKSLEVGYKGWLESELPINTLRMPVDYNEFIPVHEMVIMINKFMQDNNCYKKI